MTDNGINDQDPKPDWILSNLYGRIPEDINEMRKTGDFVTGFDLKESEDYWKLPDVQKAFTDPQSGQPQKKNFDEYYKNMRSKYAINTNSEINFNNLETTFTSQYARKVNALGPRQFSLKGNPDPYGRAFVSTTGYTEKQRGIHETAIKTGVRLDDGSYVHPAEYDGYTKFAKEQGGAFKLNENGSPYLEAVKDGEELKSYEQIYSSRADFWGYYGHDYEVEQIISFLPKNLYSFVSQVVDSVAEFPKTIISAMGYEKSETYKNIVDVENWAKSMDWGKTEKGQDFSSFENLTDLGFQVTAQLAAMWASGGLTAITTGSEIAGSIAGKAFMTAISAGDMAEVARENNLTPMEQLTLLGIYSAAVYGISGLDNAVIKGFNTAGSKAALRDMAMEHAVILKGLGGNKTGLLAVMQDAKLGWRSAMHTAGKTTAGQYAGAAVTETLEESAEAAAMTGMKVGYNQYNDLVDSGQDRKNKFNIDWLAEAQNVGYSAIGGAIGGVMAKKLFKAIGVKNPDLTNSIWEMVADGKEKILYDNITKLRDQEKLGLGWKTPEGVLTKDKLSENEASYNIIKSVIDYNVEIRESLGLNALKEVNNNKAGEQAQYVKLSSIGKDAAVLGGEINDLEAKLVDQAKADPDTIKTISEQIEIKRRKLTGILEGHAVDDYIAEGAFNFTTLTNSKQDADINFSYLNGKSFVELHKSVPAIKTIETARVTEELAILAEKDKSATIDNFEGVSQIGKTRILGEAQTKFHDLLTAKLPDLNQALGFAPDDPIYMDMSHKPEDFQSNMQSIIESEFYDDSTKKVAADFMLESAKLQVLESYNPTPTPKIPTEESFYLNMIERIPSSEHSQQIATTTPVPIQEMLQKETQLENDSMLNGVSLYMNTPQIKKIQDSVKARIAQLKGGVATRSILPQSRAEFIKLPTDANALLKELKGYEAEAARLLKLSEDNLNSSDLRVKQVTIKVIYKQLESYEQFAMLAITKPEFVGVRDILKKYRESIYNSVTSNDVDGMLRGILLLESETYDTYSDQSDQILALYEEAIPDKLNISNVNSTQYDGVIDSYNYIRGILSEKASRVMSAYEKVVNKAQGQLAATNQDVIARAAVHALQADKYAPNFIADTMQNIELNNSVMIHSEGGAGKTSQVIPIVVGMMQELNGGKTFLTSKNNDGGKRIAGLRKAVREYYSEKDPKLSIRTVDTTKTISEFLKSGAIDTNLIVYDEATLLTLQELAEIKKEQDRINSLRKNNNVPLLKILFTGDTYQNNANTDKNNPDTEVNGVGSVLYTRIATTQELNFSFRSLNQSLKLFNDYIRSAQFLKGYPKNVALFEYQGKKGVRVFHTPSEFEAHVISEAKDLKASGEITKAIYVTDKPLALLSPEIINSGIQVLSSEAAQGNEWDYVFFDPSNNNLFAEGSRNLAIKKDFYTGSTRAKKYFATVMPKEQMIASRAGTVYDLKPLSVEQNSKEKKLESLSKILEGLREEIGVSPLVYSQGNYKVVDSSILFPEVNNNSQAPDSLVEVSIEDTPIGEPVASQFTPEAAKFADFLSNADKDKDGFLPLFTFFTPGATEKVDQLDLKKKAIYDTKGQMSSYQYFISIAKIGTAEYHNVVNNDPKYNGTYAAFIEAFVDGNKTIIGLFPQNAFGKTTTLDKFITDNNLLGDDDTVSFKISSDLIMNAIGKAPTVFNQSKATNLLEKIKANSPNVNFGSPKMYSASDENYKLGRGGRAFVPTSTLFSTQQIDDILAKGKEHPYISFVHLNYKKMPFEEAANNLRRYVVDGKYNFDGEGKNVYHAFWGNMAKESSETRSSERFKTISEAFIDILKDVPIESEYYKFLSPYANKTTRSNKKLKLSAKTEEALANEPEIILKDKSYFFMANYLEADKRLLPMFQKAIGDLYKQESYKEGFSFDLQLAKNSTEAESRLFAGAHTLPQEFLNQYLEARVDYVSMPILRFDPNDVSDSLIRAKPEVTNSASIVEKEVAVETGPFPNEVVPFENYDEAQTAFDAKDSKSLIDFKDRFFSGRDVVHMRPTIDLFRRTMFDKLFVTKNTDKPLMNNINKAVKDYKKELENNLENAKKFGFGLDNDANMMRYYNLVIRGNFDFLLSKYFPVVAKEGKDYVYKSKHFTDQSWFDKENYSHIHQGMTEMVKMLLFNTPLISTQPGNKLKATGRYLNFSDIEEVIDGLRDGATPTTAEEFSKKLSPLSATSDASRSLYYRYFSPSHHLIDGVKSYSISAMTDKDSWTMIDAFRSFFMSGQAYALAKVDLATGKNNLPTSVFGTPNLIRQHGYDSINSQMKHLGDNIISGNSTVRINGEIWFKSTERQKSGKPYTDADVIRAMHLIGLPFFNQDTLTDLQENGLANLDITPGSGSEQALRNRLIDNVFFETVRKFVDSKRKGLTDVDDNVITSYTNAIFKSVARKDGMNNVLLYTNLDGKRVYRLRNTAPIFTIKDKILRIQQSATSPLSKNSFVTGDFKIRTPYVKEGFSSERNGKTFRKSANQLFPDEMLELDLFWGFINELEKSYKNTSEFKTASFPVMAYSDGSTMMDLVVDSKHGFMSSLSDTVQRSFNSQQEFYKGMANSILIKWSPLVSAQNIQGLKTLIDRNKIPTEQIEKIPGMIVNRDYVDNKGFASIKQTLIDQMEIFSDINAYHKILAENFEKMKKSMRPKAMGQLTEMLKDNKNLSKYTPDTLLKSFYYNWAAISNDIQLLTNGEISNFKGSNASKEYIEMVKRAKSEVSSHNTPIFRNESWAAQVQQYKANGGTDLRNQRPDLFYEGHKLNKNYKVAFVHDPIRVLISLSGEIKNQEVYDGATFVTPLTRIFQRYSNGHEHGLLTPPVMKNITTYYDIEQGNKMFIKNAEFELTPEIIRNGTQQTIDIVKKMLGNNILSKLIGLGVNPDLSNVEPVHFEQLADIIVEEGLQDEFIMEIIPTTSVKTGRRATTNINDEFIPTLISITSKGSQLDASKDPSSGLFTKTPTQMISSMSTNWRNPDALRQMFDAIEGLSNNFLENIPTDLRAIVRKAVETREGILYSNQLVRDDDFSLDDRQILETLVSNFNSLMVNNSISVDFQGGHYVVHPSDGIVEVYDTKSGVKLKSQLTPEEANLPGRPLNWIDPVNKAGIKFSEFKTQSFIDRANEEGHFVTSYPDAIKAMSPDTLQELNEYFQEELSSGNWTNGEAEILLPADMLNEFMLEKGKSIDSFNRLYFANKIADSGYKGKYLNEKAEAMFKAFTAKIHGIMSRIPNTGKHSAVNTKVVGFMGDSMNSVFVPSMLLFIQGADQDVDKGAYLTYQSVKGILPEVDANYKLINGYLFNGQKAKGETLSDRQKAVIAAYKNKVVDSIRGIMGDSANALESNISVDSVMSELKNIRDQKESTQDYNRYDYTSLTRMIQINQSGKRLVGTFANGLKAYQNLYTYYKLTGVAGPIADLNTDFNKTWITFAAFINAATDNAKEQILGAMGINDYNAGIVSYLIATGKTATEIDQFLTDNKSKLDEMNSFHYYDSEYGFNSDVVWGNTELNKIYKLSKEYRVVASSIMNTSKVFPKKSGDMYAYKNMVETWVKDAYKSALGQKIPFSIVKFMDDDAYAKQHIKLYDKVIATSQYFSFNFLGMLKTVPHLRGYMKTFTTALSILEDNSRVINLTNRLGDEFAFPNDEGDDEFVKEETYRDMTDFVYGGLIDLYFKSQDKKIGGFDLTTPEERSRFVDTMNTSGKERLQSKYPDHSFVKTLFVEDAKRKGRISQRLRTYDLMHIEEEKLLEMQVMFQELEESERDSLIAYSMIVDKNKMGKGSWTQLLSPSDMKDFNDFVRSVNPDTLEMNVKVYKDFNSSEYDSGLKFNAIPYSFTTIKGIAVDTPSNPDIRKREVVQMVDKKPTTFSDAKIKTANKFDSKSNLTSEQSKSIDDLKSIEPTYADYNNQQDIRGREPVHMTRTAIDLISELLPKDYSITYSKGMVSIDSPIEIRRGKVKTNTTLGNYLKSLYDGTAPESVDLDQVDRQKVKGAIDYYDKIKNEINFTYDKTKEDMKSCGIKIKAL